jgi:hypothetical protein
MMSSWHHHDIKLASNNSHRFVHSVKTTADGPHLIRLSCSPSPTATARYLPHELRNWINEFTARLQIQFLDPRSDSIRSWGIKTLLSALPCPIIHGAQRTSEREREGKFVAVGVGLGSGSPAEPPFRDGGWDSDPPRATERQRRRRSCVCRRRRVW